MSNGGEPDPILAKAEIAYKEAVRVIEEQDKARDAYRSRAVTVLTVATIAASLFGFTELESNPLFWVGLAGLAAIVVCVIFLYVPRGWMVNPASEAVTQFVEDDRQSPAFMFANLAISHQENFETNSRLTDKMSYATIALLLGLLVMIVAWTTNAVIADPASLQVQKVQIVEAEE